MSNKHTTTYWRARLISKSGTFHIRPRVHGGERHWISLDTGNKDIAAKRALDKYELIKANGWEAHLKPEVEKTGELTIGKFLDFAKEKLVGEQMVKPKTFRISSDRIIKFVKGIEGIPTYAGKDFTPEKAKAAKDRALNTPFAVLTKAAIEAYKVEYLAAHSEASNGGATTFNSDLASAASLFKDDIVESVGIANPFAGVKRVKVSTNVFRYKSKFDLRKLLEAAKDEAEKDIDFQPIYECLAFAAGTGCRKEEIDLAKWSDVDLDKRKFHLAGDHLKTDASEASITIVKSIAERLKSFKKLAPDAEYVIKGRDTLSLVEDREAYRCEILLKKLVKWIRAYEDENGIKPFADVDKPLHTIRKEVGSMLYKETGDIYAAKTYLRHSQISTTINYYVDNSNQEAPTIDF